MGILSRKAPQPDAPATLPFPDPAREWLDRATATVQGLRQLPQEMATLSREMPDLDLAGLLEVWRLTGQPVSYQGSSRAAEQFEALLKMHSFGAAQGVERIGDSAIRGLDAKAKDLTAEQLPEGVLFAAVFETHHALLWTQQGTGDAPGMLLGLLHKLPPGHPYLAHVPISEAYRLSHMETGAPCIILGYEKGVKLVPVGWAIGQTLGLRQIQKDQMEQEAKRKKLEQEAEDKALKASEWWLRNRVDEMAAELAALKASQAGTTADAAAGTGGK